MQALPVKTRLTMPMVIAGFVLAGGFIAIAWTVQWATGGSSARITQATTAGAAAISAPAANAVTNSLPAFTLDLDGAVAIEIPTIDARWIDPQDLDRVDVGIGSFVWMGWWFGCSFINDDYDYSPIGMSDPPTGQDAIDIAHWNELTFRQQQNVKEACK